MRILLLSVLTLFLATVRAQNYPPAPGPADSVDPQQELESLGSLNGDWRGFLQVNYDPVGAYRNRGAGFEIFINISGNHVDVQVYDENRELTPLAVENYIYSVEGTAMINTVNRNNGFVENFSIFLAHVDRDRMEGYVSRTVHNYLVRNTSPWRVIPVYGRLIMDRQ